MSNLVEIPEMDSDVSEYTELERSIAQDFLKGIIKLGAVLKKHRDKWKPKRQYTEYLTKINKNIQATNQIIRIYEYSIDHMNNLLSVNLTGWSKLNMFLALPDDLKDKLANDIDGNEITTNEFKEKITEVKVDEGIVETNLFPIADDEIEGMIKRASLDNVDIKFMAKQVIQEMRNNDVGDFSDNCVPIASGFLHVEQAIKYWEEEKFDILTRTEKKFWNKIVTGQIDRLTKLLK